MGNGVSRAVGCFVPGTHDQDRVVAFFSEQLDEGLGHSFCYVRPVADSPHPVPPCHSETYVVFSSPFDSEPRNGSIPPGEEIADDNQKPRNLSETTFKSISGASVSANTSTPRTIILHEQFKSYCNLSHDRAAAFESTASFSSLPLQPVPRGVSQSGPVSVSLAGAGSGPLDRGFLSGPLERGFMSGPLERGFMSGPLERSYMSGPIETTDPGHFSAPLAGRYPTYVRKRRKSLARLMRTVGKPVRRAISRTVSKTSSAFARTQRSLIAPVRLFVRWHGKHGGAYGTTTFDSPLDSGDTSSELDSKDNHNLQWAQGKAGEDRVHVVLSEEHGWLFVGIYDGFSGPDAPDFLMSNLYPAVYKELQGLLWGRKEEFEREPQPNRTEEDQAAYKNKRSQESKERNSEITSTNAEQRPAEEGARSYVVPLYPQNGRQCESEEDEHIHAKLSARQDPGISGPVLDSLKQEECPRMEKCNGFVTDIGLQGAGNTGLQDAGCQDERQEMGNTPGGGESENGAEPVGDGPITRSGSERACKKVNHERDLSEENSRNKKSGNHQNNSKGRSFFRLRSRQLHTRRKENHGKLFPWRYDWEEDKKEVEEKLRQDELKGCKHDAADHSAILLALARALEATEAAYLDMADQTLEENPELALMGSCVLVMLMKDEDVYVMNVGDSRAILAQQSKCDSHVSLNGSQYLASSGHDNCTVDNFDRIGARDSLLRLELERIIEETPIELEGFEVPYNPSNVGPPATGLSLSALQLSTDHSTSIEEEVLRIKAEHPDDNSSIFNDRVKGSLKVTRAFGAGFLKKPKWNSALLEMFRIDYVGMAPYISCAPALHHHRLTGSDHFLVLSSDGLYQYLSNQEVVSHVEWFMEKFPDGDPAQHLIEELLFRAAEKAGMEFHELLDIPQGDRRKYHDDVSVMVISLEGRIWRSSG